MQEPNDLKIEPNNNIESLDIEKSLVDENDELENDFLLDEDEFWDDDNDWDNDSDCDDHYGSSGEKFGWYNGFSDDAIDDAFEGDPDATWNVD